MRICAQNPEERKSLLAGGCIVKGQPRAGFVACYTHTCCLCDLQEQIMPMFTYDKNLTNSGLLAHALKKSCTKEVLMIHKPFGQISIFHQSRVP